MILLDDASSRRESPRSRLYREVPFRRLVAFSEDELFKSIDEIEASSRDGLFWVVALSYEAGRCFNHLCHSTTRHSEPLLQAAAFRSFEFLERAESHSLLASDLDVDGALAGLLNVHPSTSREHFCKVVQAARQEIGKGTFYQLNLTFSLTGSYYGSETNLYRRLRQQQPTRFGALWLDDDFKLLSFSPEWFLANERGTLVAKPMKGTRSRTSGPPGSLSEDPKNRAENLMIVDLLRNDLGRISGVGSVEVPKLFEVERIGALEQMTSTITARLSPDIGLFDVLKATYPCGSITGAPKQKAMEWIESLEPEPRGMYCGALGWIDPPSGDQGRIGNFAFSVLIRTLEVLPNRQWRLGVGAGITIDSNPEEEWKECLAKAEFVTSLGPEVGLFETMRMEHGVIFRWEMHRRRLAESARILGIPIDMNVVDALVGRLAESCSGQGALRLRLSADPNGRVDLRSEPLKALSSTAVFWAHQLLPRARMSAQDPLLLHKVTRREAYDQAWQRAESLGGFDAIFTNDNGEVTEGGRSNIFIKKEGVWLTPPLSSGLLPGIMRAELLASKDWNAKESVIYPADVKGAQEIVVCNSLRGAIEVKLKG